MFIEHYLGRHAAFEGNCWRQMSLETDKSRNAAGCSLQDGTDMGLPFVASDPEDLSSGLCDSLSLSALFFLSGLK